MSLLLGLAGCSVNQFSLGQDGTPVPYPGPVKPARAATPGDYPFYSFGISQKYEDMEAIDIAQAYYGVYGGYRSWGRVTPGRTASATKVGLQLYFPLHVRWRLKDGREFILENIDVPQIMREYFKSNSIRLQWQREGRPKARVGDFEGLLAYEVQGDSVLLKWVLVMNRIPAAERVNAEGKVVRWDTYDEEYLVARIKGNPVGGIDFSKTYEVIR
ncbi:hypothetical protein [uncultured Hydrogenophaga sp.]|uniref:hypothetical protein n=1 Tax=uncultured Hydrogenophaga sp. TaxID=199683 RepID=UPI003747B180